MSLRISDQDKIYLNFFGNHRGFLVNVASGHEVVLMNPTSQSTRVDPIMNEMKHLIRPRTMEDNFDYMRGKFNPRPTLGFVDRAKHFTNNAEGGDGGGDLQGNMNYSSAAADDRYQNDDDMYRRSGGGSGDFVNFMDHFPDCRTTMNGNGNMLHCLPIATYNRLC